ncbi:MAG: hypothetical protein IPK19_03505 [Chloroflexi bacterium]|nr:hypothetical protein [Chloroflexota bacterium]
MQVKVNPTAVEHALQLIGEGKYRINSVWRDNRPTPEALARFAATHGVDEASRWYLGENLDAPAGSPERFVYPIGDFSNVHETGIRAARERAAVDGQDDLADAAESVLELFYRMNAC